jgi:hypothetical protein
MCAVLPRSIPETLLARISLCRKLVSVVGCYVWNMRTIMAIHLRSLFAFLTRIDLALAGLDAEAFEH